MNLCFVIPDLCFEKPDLHFQNPDLHFQNPDLCVQNPDFLTYAPPYVSVAAGLCSKWLHKAIDFAIKHNYWPVRFVGPDGSHYDFNTPFLIAVWVFYVHLMYGRPALRANAPQMVLKYLYSQPALVVRAWRARIYKFSSATVFTEVSIALKDWVQAQDVSGDVQTNTRRKRTNELKKLKNVPSLYQMIADTMFRFIQRKTNPFPSACKSQRNFLAVDSWKRAMLFVHLFRHVTDSPANRQWHRYGHEQYTTNVKLFRRYMNVDKVVVEAGDRFRSLPETTQSPKKKRKVVSDSSGVDMLSPAKTALDIVSSDDENSA